jgi:hypothetical protein
MNRILTATASALLAAILCACGGAPPVATPPGPAKPVEPAPAPAPAVTPAARPAVSDREAAACRAHFKTVCSNQKKTVDELAFTDWSLESIGGDYRHVRVRAKYKDDLPRHRDLVFVLDKGAVVDMLEHDDWKAQKETFLESQPAATVDASDLASAWLGNAATAEAFYKYKILRVTGWVGQVAKDSDGLPDIELQPPDGFGKGIMPRASISWRMAAEAAKLRAGQKITVQGACLGRRGNHPVIRRCSILREK